MRQKELSSTLRKGPREAEGKAASETRPAFDAATFEGNMKHACQPSLNNVNDLLSNVVSWRPYDYQVRSELDGIREVAIDFVHSIYENSLKGDYGIPSKTDVEYIEETKKSLVNTIEERYAVALFVIERIISPEKHIEPPLSVDERLNQLEEYVRRRGDVGVAQFTRLLFPELSALPDSRVTVASSALPTIAPATWKADKQPGETPPAFVKRVYGEWLGQGLDRAIVRKLDPPLIQALENWLRKNAMPPDVDLPTRQEQNTRWVERMEKDGISAVIPAGSADFVVRESRRLQSAQKRRDR